VSVQNGSAALRPPLTSLAAAGCAKKARPAAAAASASPAGTPCPTARAGNRRFGPLSAVRAHTNVPYRIDFHKKTLRALNRPWAARADGQEAHARARPRDGGDHLGFGRTVASGTEAPNMLANPV
jgi:hypothetical protein